jgi:hypothetical protein
MIVSTAIGQGIGELYVILSVARHDHLAVAAAQPGQPPVPPMPPAPRLDITIYAGEPVKRIFIRACS